LTKPGSSWIGPLAAVVGVLGFSLKAILIKLAYAWEPIDPVTLLALRMLYSAPFFAIMAWFATRSGVSPRRRQSPRGAGLARGESTPGGRRAPLDSATDVQGGRRARTPIARSDWLRILWLGFIGYYLASLVDFTGLQYVTASLERLMLYLYPTLVVILSALFYKQRITGRIVVALALSYAGIVLVFGRDLSLAGDPHALWLGGSLVFAGAALYALYLVGAGPVIARLGSLRFIAWAMLISAVFVLLQFALTRPFSALAVPARIQLLSLTMAVFSTVLPTYLIAEAIKRIGANRTSLVGSLGPVFTIWLGWWLLGEPVHWIQLGGVALVLAGVALVSLRPKPEVL
jgi:drug/metabolite transporter (DMT)-like permease